MTSTIARDTTGSTGPQQYLDKVLDFIRRSSYRSASVDIDGIVANARRSGATAATSADTYPVIRTALQALGDRHSALLDPVAAASFLRGQATGYGFRIYPPDVVWVLPGSPAEAAGLRTLDRIRTLNGVPFNLTTLADRQATVGVLSIVRNGVPMEISVTRGAIVTTDKPIVRALDGRLGYLDLPGSTGDHAAETAFAQTGADGVRALETSVHPCGWVVDLRRNTGGFPFSMMSVLEPLLGDGPVGGFVYADGHRDLLSFTNGVVRVGTSTAWTNPTPVHLADPAVPVVLLTSPMTASAGELAAIAFAGRSATRVIGEPTDGLTSANVGISLEDGAFVMVTHSQDIDRSGRVYDGPLDPDQAVANDWTLYDTDADPVLSAGRAWLSAQPSCSSR